MILLNWRNSQNYDEMELGAIYERSNHLYKLQNRDVVRLQLF